jgi:hypothetical protein
LEAIEYSKLNLKGKSAGLVSTQSLVESKKLVDSAVPDVGTEVTVPSVGGPLINTLISL